MHRYIVLSGKPTELQMGCWGELRWLAPYRLTAWMYRPQRIVVLTSGMQQRGSTDLSDLDWTRRRSNGMQAYSDSKLLDATFAAALGRRWPDVLTVSVSPGWVATKMGGASAPDDRDAASATQAWIAGSHDHAAFVSGAMYYHRKPVRSPGASEARSLHPAVRDTAFQDGLLTSLAELTGADLPS